jgi:HAD superfamily hydrolase (TIGR01509 family)
MILPKRPGAVIFDMDGLLFNSEVLSFESAVSAALHCGYTIEWVFFKTLIGRQWPDISLCMQEEFGAQFPATEFRATWLSHYEAMLDTRLAIKPGVVELLDVLDHYAIPRAIATSSVRERVIQKTEFFSLLPRFHHVVAQGDYDRGKPEPDPFLKAAELLQVAPELCLALEDSHNGIRSAHAAGMMAVMVPDLLEPTDEIRALCAAVASDLHQVAEMIQQKGRT